MEDGELAGGGIAAQQRAIMLERGTAARGGRDDRCVGMAGERRLGGAAFRAVSRPLLPGVRDTQCGFKFFARELVVRALEECRVTNFAFDVELLRRVRQAGGDIVEVSVTWTDDARSTFHPVRDGIPSFLAVLQLHAA